MDKTIKKKTLAIVISCVVVILVAVFLYIAFGVIGTDSKVVYGQSNLVNANKNGSNTTVIDVITNYQVMNGLALRLAGGAKTSALGTMQTRLCKRFMIPTKE